MKSGTLSCVSVGLICLLAPYVCFGESSSCGLLPEEVPEALTESQCDELRRFLRPFPEFTPDNAKILGWCKSVDQVRPQALLEIRLFSPENHMAEIDFNVVDGTVTWWLLLGGPPESFKDDNTPMEDVLTAEQAFQAAVPFLQHYSLSTDMSGYRVLPHPFILPHNARCGLWLVEKYLDYEGVPCWPSKISISVSAWNGRVSVLSYTPVIVPENEPREITREQAIERVRHWTSTEAIPNWYAEGGEVSSVRLRENPLQDTVLIISVPNEFFNVREFNPLEPLRSYYSWAVPVLLCLGDGRDAREFPLSVCVNTANAEILGFADSADKLREMWGVEFSDSGAPKEEP